MTMTKTMKAVALGAIGAIWAGLPLAARAADAAAPDDWFLPVKDANAPSPGVLDVTR